MLKKVKALVGLHNPQLSEVWRNAQIQGQESLKCMYANPLSGYISFHHSPGSADGLWVRKHHSPIHCINLNLNKPQLFAVKRRPNESQSAWNLHYLLCSQGIHTFNKQLKDIKKHGSPVIEANDSICILRLCLRWTLILKRDVEVEKKKNVCTPLLSAPPAELSGVGSMSSKPQETLCLPPRRHEGEPGPPSRSNSLKREFQGGYTLKILNIKEETKKKWEINIWPLTCTGRLTQEAVPCQFVSAAGELYGWRSSGSPYINEEQVTRKYRTKK